MAPAPCSDKWCNPAMHLWHLQSLLHLHGITNVKQIFQPPNAFKFVCVHQSSLSST